MAIIIFEHSELANAGTLGRILGDHGHRLKTLQLHRGDPVPTDLDEVDGIISCGGGCSANDDSLPWLAPEMDFLEAAVLADVPVVGICLGNQILGRALNGKIETMDGPEVGWYSVQLTNAGTTDIVHAGIGWSTMQLQWHGDYIARLPEGAVVLAKSDQCPVQAWRLGQRVYGFQYHPEADRATVESWADDEPQAVTNMGLTRESLMAATDEHLPQATRLANRLFEHIALLVMPIDRRTAGLTKALHH